MKPDWWQVAGALLAFGLAGRLAAATAEAVSANPAQWPEEVTVTSPARATLVKNDRAGGTVALAAGRKLPVVAVQPGGIVARLGDATVLLPVEKTDLFARVAAKEKDAPVVAPVPSAAPPTAIAAPPPAKPAVPAGPPTKMQTALAGRLVQLHGGALQACDGGRLDGVRFYALYFSAGWCGPCRQFSPSLVQTYQSLRNLYPEFELVMCSSDRTEGDMLAYMRDERMPWPALRFEERRLRDVRKHAGSGIPCLVLVDADGKELSHSYRWGRYVGPDAVVDDTWRILRQHRRDLAARQRR